MIVQRAIKSVSFRSRACAAACHRKISLIRLRIMALKHGLPSIDLADLTGPPRATYDQEVILERICMPPYAYPWKHDDFGAIMRIAETLNPKVILELGTAYGNLTANLCRKCPNATIYTIDAPVDNQTGRYVTYSLSRDEIGEVYRTSGYSSRVIQVYSNTLTLDLRPYFPRPTIDLAIIDACHDRNYVLSDFYKVKAFIRTGGAILLHDTHPSMHRHLAYSYAACMELRKSGFEIRHIRDTWWAIWVNKVGSERDSGCELAAKGQ
jgi:predicted O-methyltransferase YrrM